MGHLRQSPTLNSSITSNSSTAFRFPLGDDFWLMFFQLKIWLHPAHLSIPKETILPHVGQE
jgi:hypothetical protein